MQNFLFYLQIVSAILLVLTILLQNKSAGLGAAFGGSSNSYSSKRGIDRILSSATVLFAILFFGTALAHIFV